MSAGWKSCIKSAMKGTEFGVHVALEQVILNAILRKATISAVDSERGTLFHNWAYITIAECISIFKANWQRQSHCWKISWHFSLYLPKGMREWKKAPLQADTKIELYDLLTKCYANPGDSSINAAAMWLCSKKLVKVKAEMNVKASGGKTCCHVRGKLLFQARQQTKRTTLKPPNHKCAAELLSSHVH